MRYDYYQYEELKTVALDPNATQEAVDDLGRWFQRYDPYNWNGEYYTVDEANQIHLWPVLAEDEDGNFEVIHYSFDKPDW